MASARTTAGAGVAGGMISQLIWEVRDAFPEAVFKLGVATCAAAAGAVGGAGAPTAVLIGVFVGGVCIICLGAWLAVEGKGNDLCTAAKAAIFSVASLPLAVGAGFIGPQFLKFAFRIFGAMV